MNQSSIIGAAMWLSVGATVIIGIITTQHLAPLAILLLPSLITLALVGKPKESEGKRK